MIIGKDIPWKHVEGLECLVKRFEPLATVEMGNVEAPPLNKPYAWLTVECPMLPTDEALMPVFNKVDFLNLWEVYQQRGVGTDEAVTVSRESFFHSRLLRFLFSSGMPWLHISLYSVNPSKGYEVEGLIAQWIPKNYRYKLGRYRAGRRASKS